VKCPWLRDPTGLLDDVSFKISLHAKEHCTHRSVCIRVLRPCLRHSHIFPQAVYVLELSHDSASALAVLLLLAGTLCFLCFHSYAMLCCPVTTPMFAPVNSPVISLVLTHVNTHVISLVLTHVISLVLSLVLTHVNTHVNTHVIPHVISLVSSPAIMPVAPVMAVGAGRCQLPEVYAGEADLDQVSAPPPPVLYLRSALNRPVNFNHLSCIECAACP
jgi:hypothetical protein